MKSVHFHCDAEVEMIKAAVWYKTKQADLGNRFLTSVQDAINRIKLNPGVYPFVDTDIRRCLVRTFPFGILFRDKSSHIEVMAIMHLHRDPNYWKSRVLEKD